MYFEPLLQAFRERLQERSHIQRLEFFSPSETRPRSLERYLCSGITRRPQHSLHTPALPVHTDVRGPRHRKYRRQTSAARVSYLFIIYLLRQHVSVKVRLECYEFNTSWRFNTHGGGGL